MQCLFWAAFILLLDVSISQDVPVPCKDVNDCQTLTETPQIAMCIDAYCKCRSANGTLENCKMNTSTNSTVSKDPQRQVTGIVGHVCALEKDCTNITPESFCNTARKQCECKPGYFGSADNLSCIHGIRYGESGCTSDLQCLYFDKNTTCREGFCVCAPNHMHDKTACFEQKKFGTSCSLTSECLQVDEAVCGEQNLCVCPVTRVINPNITACLPIASNINDNCLESIQCTQLLGMGGVCMDHHCKCHESHHHSTISFKCVLNSELGGECQTDDECSNGDANAGYGHMRCSANRCVCVEGFKDIGGKCEVTGSGGSAASRYVEVATLVVGLAYFVLFSAML